MEPKHQEVVEMDELVEWVEGLVRRPLASAERVWNVPEYIESVATRTRSRGRITRARGNRFMNFPENSGLFPSTNRSRRVTRVRRITSTSAHAANERDRREEQQNRDERGTSPQIASQFNNFADQILSTLEMSGSDFEGSFFDSDNSYMSDDLSLSPSTTDVSTSDTIEVSDLSSADVSISDPFELSDPSTADASISDPFELSDPSTADASISDTIEVSDPPTADASISDTIEVSDLPTADVSISDPLTAFKCAICLEEYVRKAPVSTPCGHIYCYKCIVRWLRTSNDCPKCKKRVHRESLIHVFL